jgi:hypothetical protein
MKKKLVTIISLLISLCFSACSTNPGLPDRNTPVRELVLINIVSSYESFYYGGRNLTYFTQTSGKRQALLPAGKQKIEASWLFAIHIGEERHVAGGTEREVTYKITQDSIEYEFVPGKEYTIKQDVKLRIEDLGYIHKDGKVKDSHTLWIGGPIVYMGWMYPNAYAGVFGMKEGVEIFAHKSDFKITAEATAGLGASFKPILEEFVSVDVNYSPKKEKEFNSVIFTLPFTAGLKTEYLITPDFGITLGGGITGAYALPSDYSEKYINNKGEVDYRDPDPLMPIIPYIQAQLNFRKGRTENYPSWPLAPLSIYFNYYPKLPSNRASFFGVGIVFADM